jgi:diaminohydroxyphosphoribosylaminopyrimidine deaminase/5-amino-6-(5-phosphoribosylamino)uracil reductase
MRRALRLAARGSGETNPNPLVGCVIVNDGRVVGEGFHARAGGPHAEAIALEQAAGRARGATLYVTLEPCAHHGRTPPCAPRVAAAGIARVVAAITDPFPRVSGRGLALLRRAGVRVETGVEAEAARELNAVFLGAARLRRPFVLLKAAATLDGRIATASGESKWITGAAQRRAARALRRLCDGVLVGVGTALADDPLLLPSPRTRRPAFRLVLDSRLRLPLESRLVRSISPRAPLLVVTCEASLRARAAHARRLTAAGAAIVPVPERAGHVPLPAALAKLRRLGLLSLMVEGGSEVLGSFLAERLFDAVVLFRAPLLLGGRGSRPAFGGPDPKSLAEAVRLTPGPPLARLLGALSRTTDGPLAEVWYPRFR